MESNPPKTLGERLKKARKAVPGRLTQQNVADQLGVSDKAVSAWERNADTPSVHRLTGIADLYGVSVEYLLEVADLPNGDGPRRQPNRRDGGLRQRAVPLISRVQAGAWNFAEDPYPMGEGQERIFTDRRVSDRAFALEVEGNSMADRFQEGDRIIIDPQVEATPGDFVVAKIIETNEVTFKKFRPRGVDKDGQPIFELKPLNDDWPPIIVTKEAPAEIIGAMVEHRWYRPT